MFSTKPIGNSRRRIHYFRMLKVSAQKLTYNYCGAPSADLRNTVALQITLNFRRLTVKDVSFQHSGYIVGLIGTLVLGSIATYCVHMVINIHYDLCKWKKVC